jgi:hypothetical protein
VILNARQGPRECLHAHEPKLRHARKGARLLAWGAYEAMLHGSEIGGVGSAGIGRSSCSDPDPILPFKADAARRHHIPADSPTADRLNEVLALRDLVEQLQFPCAGVYAVVAALGFRPDGRFGRRSRESWFNTQQGQSR